MKFKEVYLHVFYLKCYNCYRKNVKSIERLQIQGSDDNSSAISYQMKIFSFTSKTFQGFDLKMHTFSILFLDFILPCVEQRKFI